MKTHDEGWRAIKARPLPNWFDEAKLGIFIHWGLYSVPGWAPRGPDIQQILRERSPRWLFQNMPYAEWYANTMQLERSPTQRHHNAVYGPDYPYDRFAPIFNEASSGADLDALASLCHDAGARYVVLTTKHCDGYCLWPTSVPHPYKRTWHATRDLVGTFTEQIRSRGLRMGLYYSGGWDWSFDDGVVVARLADLVLASPPSDDYAGYADAHVRELVDRYEPSLLWNDVSWPPAADLLSLFTDYYKQVPDGVVNDRWFQPSFPRSAVSDALVRGIGLVIEGLWHWIPSEYKVLTFPTPQHCDFSTPEYRLAGEVVPEKWEATRGVGHSFGANRNEAPEDVLTAAELVRLVVDIVSKNGNLLLGIGPMPDGTIPDWQREPVLEMGRWLQRNGEAIYGTRPWGKGSSTTSDGTQVRFSQRDGVLYAMMLGLPGTRRFVVQGVAAEALREVTMLDGDFEVEWSAINNSLEVLLPERVPVSPVYALRLAPAPVPIPDS